MKNTNEVVGWGTAGAAWARPDAEGVSRAIATTLYEVGVREAFGLLGGGIAPFAAGLSNTPIRFFHFRHEAGAGFAALESWFETGRPGVVVVTTGPGLMNVLNAVMAARVDGAKYLLISGFTSPQQVGRGAVQETSLASMPADVVRPGSLFHDVAIPETVEALAAALARFKRGLSAPGGFVAHLGLPLSLQTQLLQVPLPRGASWEVALPAPHTTTIDRCLAFLEDPSAVLWLGHGARGAAETLRTFAERARLPVICSPRAKGIFPESHPLFLGVSGAGGSPRVQRYFGERRPKHALVIGTRLGEVTSFLSQGLMPSEGWVQVDLDPTAFGAAFSQPRGLGVVSDANLFAQSLQRRAEDIGWFQRRPLSAPIEAPPAVVPLSPLPESPVRPPYLMERLQSLVIDRTDALLMSEAGASFTWCNSHLRFEAPNRYRTSAAWGSMGHSTSGCIGAALAGKRRVVAVVGDGAMLMNNELNTAVQYAANVTYVVLNDAQLGLNEHGMTALGMRPVETQMPRTDFVAFANAQGMEAIAVHTEPELDAALERANGVTGPFLVDVTIDRSLPSPVVADRIRSLQHQAQSRR
jgi:acetolactate synthase-1/2/3 large subunit